MPMQRYVRSFRNERVVFNRLQTRCFAPFYATHLCCPTNSVEPLLRVCVVLFLAQVAEAPADLMDRRVEITGPVDRKMVRV